MLQTYLIYNSILVGTVLYLLLQDRFKITLKPLYLVIAIIGVLRFDVGFDYDGMVRLFHVYAESEKFTLFSKEPTFYLLCKIFSFSDKGYVIILSFYIVAQLYFLYKILEYYSIEIEGIFVFITLCFLFESYDRVRQSLSILIFVYSFRFIEKSELKKYIGWIFIGSLIHYSSVILVPFYWLLQLRMKKLVYYILFFVSCVFFYTGLFEQIRFFIFSNIPIYGEIYVKNTEYLLSVDTNSGIGVLFTIAMLFISLFMLENTRVNRILLNALLMGALSFFIASGNLLLERFSQYFTFVLFVSIAIIIKQKVMYRLILLPILVLWFQASIYINRSGCCPYKTIFSEDAKNEVFKENVNVDLK